MSQHSVNSWVNGQAQDSVSVLDRGLSYGDGLFETMRWSGTEFPLLNFHLQRLQSGCECLAIPLPEERLKAAVTQLSSALNAESEAVAKIVLTRGHGGRGYSTANLSDPTLMTQIFPLPKASSVDCSLGVKLRVCDLRLAQQPVLAGVKHLNRLEQVMARAEWKHLADADDFYEGLLLDQQGYLIEAISHNVFWLRNGTLYTPSLDHCGVSGVMRRWVIEWAEQQGLALAIDNFSLSALYAADEVFICNGVYGLIPVKSIQGLQSYTVGALSVKIQASIMNLFSV